MSKIIDWAVDIFTNFDYGNRIRKKVNDCIYQHEGTIVWSFHGNIIAKADIKNGTVIVGLGGWPTKSSMDRLNTLLRELGIKGHPFRGYGTRMFASHPTFCGTSITPNQEIVLKLTDIPTGVYDYE